MSLKCYHIVYKLFPKFMMSLIIIKIQCFIQKNYFKGNGYSNKEQYEMYNDNINIFSPQTSLPISKVNRC